jgi:hypothetical protein
MHWPAAATTSAGVGHHHRHGVHGWWRRPTKAASPSAILKHGIRRATTSAPAATHSRMHWHMRAAACSILYHAAGHRRRRWTKTTPSSAIAWHHARHGRREATASSTSIVRHHARLRRTTAASSASVVRHHGIHRAAASPISSVSLTHGTHRMHWSTVGGHILPHASRSPPRRHGRQIASTKTTTSATTPTASIVPHL